MGRPGRNADGARIRRSSASLQAEGGSCGRCERSPDLGFDEGGGGHGEHDLQRGEVGKEGREGRPSEETRVPTDQQLRQLRSTEPRAAC